MFVCFILQRHIQSYEINIFLEFDDKDELYYIFTLLYLVFLSCLAPYCELHVIFIL